VSGYFINPSQADGLGRVVPRRGYATLELRFLLVKIPTTHRMLTTFSSENPEDLFYRAHSA
jgi:hypothetical protein